MIEGLIYNYVPVKVCPSYPVDINLEEDLTGKDEIYDREYNLVAEIKSSEWVGLL